MYTDGYRGTSSESSMTKSVAVVTTTFTRPMSPVADPPRMIELRSVTLGAATCTNPWTSRPLYTPGCVIFRSPCTTVSRVPAGTPVLYGPGWPEAGGGVGAGVGVGSEPGGGTGAGEALVRTRDQAVIAVSRQPVAALNRDR